MKNSIYNIICKLSIFIIVVTIELYLNIYFYDRAVIILVPIRGIMNSIFRPSNAFLLYSFTTDLIDIC